jgi:maltose alpha-D-glucosyltransferase/alpha-amylase
MLFVHNLGPEPSTVDIAGSVGETYHPNQVFGDQPDQPLGDLSALRLAGYGYRWIRLNRHPAG